MHLLMPTVHYAFRCKKGTVKHVFDPEVAATHHYRHRHLRYKYGTGALVEDYTMHKYKDRIINRIHGVMNNPALELEKNITKIDALVVDYYGKSFRNHLNRMSRRPKPPKQD